MRRRKSTPVRPNGWLSIDKTCKPSKATEKSEIRPALRHGYVKHEKDGSNLYMSDSYLLVRLPIDMAGAKTKKDREAVLPEGPILHEALKALDASRSGWFKHQDGCLIVHGNPALYPTPPGIQPPDYGKVLRERRNGEREDLSGIAFNPALLKRAAETLGVHGSGVEVEFQGRLRPMVLKPMGGTGEALVMPIRMNT